MKRNYIFIILLFYITSSYLSATHIHKQAIQEHAADCKVCIMAKNLHSGDIEVKDNISILYIHYSNDIFFIQDIIYKTILKGFNSNAPPIS